MREIALGLPVETSGKLATFVGTSRPESIAYKVRMGQVTSEVLPSLSFGFLRTFCTASPCFLSLSADSALLPTPALWLAVGNLQKARGPEGLGQTGIPIL